MLIQEAWFEVVLIRTDNVKKIAGGFSGLLGAILRCFFGGNGHDFEKSGIALQIRDGTTHHVFFRVGAFLADEAALHAGYCCKGSGGLKPCLLCANIFNYKLRRDIVDNDASGVAQHHTTHDPTKLKLHTPTSILAILQRLEQGSRFLTKAQLAELETRVGWNYVAASVMYNVVLRRLIEPTDRAIYDWMHIFFVHGDFGVHVGQTMLWLKEHGVTYARLHEHISSYNWPKFVRGVAGKDACSPKRAKSSWDETAFKATASECLSLVPVFAFFMGEFLSSAGSPNAQGHAASFLQLVRVVELILRSARCSVDPLALQSAISDYLKGFASLYGPEWMIIKFHYMLHLPKFLKQFGFLPNCFVHERKHKHPKRFANQVTNTTGNWEGSVLRDVTCNHVHALRSDDGRFNLDAALVAPHRPSKKMLSELLSTIGPAEYRVSNSARAASYEKFFKGDVVLYKAEGLIRAGQVGLLVSVSAAGKESLVVGVEKFAHVQSMQRGHKWRRTKDTRLCLLGDVIGAVIWRETPEHVFTLTPLWMR